MGSTANGWNNDGPDGHDGDEEELLGAYLQFLLGELGPASRDVCHLGRELLASGGPLQDVFELVSVACAVLEELTVTLRALAALAPPAAAGAARAPSLHRSYCVHN